MNETPSTSIIKVEVTTTAPARLVATDAVTGQRFHPTKITYRAYLHEGDPWQVVELTDDDVDFNYQIHTIQAGLDGIRPMPIGIPAPPAPYQTATAAMVYAYLTTPSPDVTAGEEVTPAEASPVAAGSAVEKPGEEVEPLISSAPSRPAAPRNYTYGECNVCGDDRCACSFGGGVA